jgi:hypothetical protein
MRYSLLPLLLASLAWGSGARAEERHYVIIFGSQSTPRLPRYTHTWATFVKAGGEGLDSTNYQIDEVFTISWLPADLVVRSLRLRAQQGVNLDLEATLAYVLQRERVSEWGPFKISQRFYERALERKAELESGRQIPLNMSNANAYQNDLAYIHGTSFGEIAKDSLPGTLSFEQDGTPREACGSKPTSQTLSRSRRTEQLSLRR